MKNFTKLVLFTAFLITVSYSQIPGNSWSVGFGGSFPRFQSTDVKPTEKNFGLYANLTRYFNDNVSLRFRGYYNYMTGIMPRGVYFYKTGGLVIKEEEMNSSVFGLSADLVYYFNPEDAVNTYFFFGVGGANISSTWDKVINPDADSRFSLQTNFGLGADWSLNENWKLKTEFGFYNVGGRLDGVPNYKRQGIFGSNDDSYVGLNVGFDYYFSKGECSKKDLHDGIKAGLTKEEVEEIVKRNLPKEIVKEVIVEKPVTVEKVVNQPAPKVVAEMNAKLKGIYFEVGSANIKSESYTTLYEVYQFLSEYSSSNVEIQGYTDSDGSAVRNKELSQQRADAVKNYLVEKGISASRLTAVGYGPENPVAPNTSSANKSLNRRIEFKLK